MRELGWIEGKNILIERRYSGGNDDRLKELAAEIVRLEVDVIVAAATKCTQTAKDATSRIPIVFVGVGDPAPRFVESLARPSGNITGVAFDATPEITAKQMQIIVAAIPGISRVAILWTPGTPYIISCLKVAETVSSTLNVILQSVEVQKPDELETAFITMIQERADAVIVLSDAFTNLCRTRITELAAQHRIPGTLWK